jgi:hypothetical protein
MAPSDNMLRRMAADLWLHLQVNGPGGNGYQSTVAGPVAFDRIAIPIIKHWFKEYDRVTQNAADHQLKREIAEYDAKGYGPRPVATTASSSAGKPVDRPRGGRVVPLNRFGR